MDFPEKDGRSKELVEFEQWRDEEMKKSAEKCYDLDLVDEKEKGPFDILLKKIPKCLIHMTRKMCNCNRECLNLSFLGSNINSWCKTHDREELWYDYRYNDCDFLKKRVVENKFLDINSDELLPSEVFKVIFDSVDNIKSGLLDLCKSEDHFDNLLCNIFDVRDVCRDTPGCLEYFLRNIKATKKKCGNTHFQSQIKEFELLLNIDLGSENINTEPADENLSSEKVDNTNLNKDECLEKYYLDVTDFIYKYDPEKNKHIISKRDTGEIIFPDISDAIAEYKQLDSHFKTIEYTEGQKFLFYSLMSISIISTLLIYILVSLGLKDKKKHTAVIPSVVMSLSVLFISLYSVFM